MTDWPPPLPADHESMIPAVMGDSISSLGDGITPGGLLEYLDAYEWASRAKHSPLPRE